MSIPGKAAALRRLLAAERRAVVAERRLRDRERGHSHEPSGAADYAGGFAFLVTFGRSGSTLLQGHLNALPGWLIRGENGDAVAMYVAAGRRTLSVAVAHAFDGPSSNSPWYGIHEVSPEHLRRRTRQLVLDEILHPRPDTRVCGFKEVHWRADDLVPLLREMQLVFPGARFIINLRSPADAARSGWWRHDDRAVETITARVQELTDAAAALGDAAFVVRYEDYTADVAALRPLLEWLGEEYDEAAHRAVASRRLTHLQDRQTQRS